MLRSICRPILKPVLRSALLSDDAPNPRSLFTAGEQGIWLDPSDFSTLFQDAGGTIPVTAVGQSVGLMLDKSKGLVLGTELASNGHFTTDLSGWFVGANIAASAVGGEASVDFAGSLTSTAGNWFALSGSYAVGKFYKVEFDATHVSGTANLQVGAGFVVGRTITPASNGGIKTRYSAIVSGMSASLFGVVAFGASAGSTTWKLDNISVRELPGNHAYQTTSASRPTLQQDSNGLYYLSFDGTDDGMVTPSIDFTGTDKMTLWAGVRKLSDAAIGVVVELSASSGANNGSFYLAASASSGQNYQLVSKGTVLAAATPSGMAAPITNVLTGIGDISGDLCRVRVNGTATSATTDQGTGNYGNYPLYIGRRAGTTLPFNGRIYQLIIRGAESNDGQIAATEAWCNSKTRAY